MGGKPGDLELPELELQPRVRELPAKEEAFRVDAIELDVVDLPRRASTRPAVAAARAEIERARSERPPREPFDPGPSGALALEVVDVPARARPTSRPPHAALTPIARPPHASPVAGPPKGFEDTFQYDTPLVNAIALPIALGFALLVQIAGLGLIVFMTVGMWTHELGHAIAGWLAGFLAIPLPFFTMTPDDRNGAVILFVAIAWIAFGAYGVRQKNRALILGAGIVGLLQIWMTFFMSPGRAFQWFLFAGLGGELLLSTVLMLAFYQRFPYRWDFWRYPVLLTSAIAFVHALVRWIGVALGLAEMPHGSAVGDNSEGDVERLIRTHEFTLTTLARTYLVIGLLCLGVLAFAYVYYLRRARHNALRDTDLTRALPEGSAR